MTNEEAISLLSDMRSQYSCFDVGERPMYHALAMAIEALQKQDVPDTNVGDMVSRKAVLDAYYANLETSECGTALNDEEFIKAIEGLPSVPENRVNSIKNSIDTVSRQDAISMVHTVLFPKIGLAKKVGRSLMRLPSAQRKTGRWMECYPEGFWKCSKCNFVSEASAADVLYHYCPNCGAKMEAEHED